MTYATDLIKTGDTDRQLASGTIFRGVMSLTVVAVTMIAVAGGALAALIG